MNHASISDSYALGSIQVRGARNSTVWVAGFAAFRFFDIMKLPPVDIIDEKMKNGAGVMLDDVVAAFYAWVVVSILGWLFG